ncbi:Fic family protein [Bordetella bronchialis]|uniref:Cell filamentation protein Fic n=1 Tax=Bordetella bronchialis TaxID=463025 RepID=A0ABM6D0A1_9BORD|nr:Fic/DOC family N-terminal domain-containing protein [Bordetella bronchialis]ANN69842.1 cell filamentation protein Fic [Bordetella bronchialis]
MVTRLASPDLSEAVQYHYGRFPPAQLDYGKLVPQLVKATDAIARFDQMLKNMHNSEILLRPLRSQEAVISSRMEGTVSTIDEILRYEADLEDDAKESMHARSEVIETFLYQRALKGAQSAIEAGQPLSQHLIRSAHQTLLSVGRGARLAPGSFKTEQNYLADRSRRKILFVPISPEHLQEGLDNLFKYIDDNSDVPLIKAAISHVEFEALHPFKDGNGRIGRMLITLLLWSAKVISAPHFYISGFFEENKDQYIDIMREVSASNDWTSWCLFFLEAVEKQAFKNLEVAENIRQLYERMKIEFSDVLASKWSVIALDYVFTYPVFRNNRFTRDSGIAVSSAIRITKALQERGHLRVLEEPSGRRPALYMFEPLLQLVRV